MAKKPGYSYSALEMFFGGPVHGGCPHAFKLIRLDKVPRQESEPLTIGKDSHGLAANYLTRLVQTGQATDWEFAATLTRPDTHPEAVEIFQRFYENFILPPIEKPGIETGLAFNRAWQPVEWFAQDAFFRMILDFTFLQGGLAVVKDFKTNRQIIEVDQDNIPLQLKIYAWGALKTIFPGAQEVLLQLDFMRYGTQREILLTPEMLAGVPLELEAKISEIESEKHFDPRPGNYCSMCGVQSHCKFMASALVPAEIMAPATRADAEKAAGLLLAMEAMDKELKARLKEWVKVNGPIQVNDMVYGHSTSISYDLDPKEVTDKLLDGGLDAEQVWGLLSTTKTALERGLKKLKRKDLLEQILAAAQSKPTEKIGFSKVK